MRPGEPISNHSNNGTGFAAMSKVGAGTLELSRANGNGCPAGTSGTFSGGLREKLLQNPIDEYEFRPRS